MTPFRSDFKNADLVETVLKECRTGWYDTSSFDSYRKTNEYDVKEDHIRSESYSYDYSYPPISTYPIYTSPEKLSARDFDTQLNAVVLPGLPEESKEAVRKAFERLKRGFRTEEQDKADKASWTKRAESSASPESHALALATRLEAFACVAVGAPYVARGLLWTGRFGDLGGAEGQSKLYQERIVAHLKAASDGSDPNCLGARGLREGDFPSTRRLLPSRLLVPPARTSF